MPIKLSAGFELLEDGTMRHKGRRARPTDVPRRYDLAKSHPLYGKRVLRVVVSGQPDSVIDASGRIVPEHTPEATELFEVSRG